MPRVLVTGANGFVGKHLLEELFGSNIEVLAVGGSQAPLPDKITSMEYITADLMNPNEVRQIDFTGVTGVIHLAGMAAVGPSFDSPLQYIQTNVGLEINLYEAALKQNAFPRFIIVSSGTLYDPKARQPLTEESPILPNSPYAVSKFGQEQMAQYYVTRGFESIIVRPFNHIGPGQGPGFIVPDLAQQIVAAEKDPQVKVMVGNLEAKRDYTDVRDIVKAYRLLLEKGKSGETYNICSGNALSGQEILDGLLKASGASPTIEEDPAKMRPSDTPVICGDYSKLKADTGWQPEIAFDQTLKDVIADWRSKS